MKTMLATATVASFGFGVFGNMAFADDTTDLELAVEDGVPVVFIADDDGAAIATPEVTMDDGVTATLTTKFTDQLVSGILGSDSEDTRAESTPLQDNRIAIENPSADVEWVVSIGATQGNDALWIGTTVVVDGSEGSPATCPGNSENSVVVTAAIMGAGHAALGDCRNFIDFEGAHATGNGLGSMNIDPSAADVFEMSIDPADGSYDTEGTAIADPESINITRGSAEDLSVDNDVVLLTSSTGADDYTIWSMKEIVIEQNIPAQTASDTYNIDFTITLV